MSGRRFFLMIPAVLIFAAGTIASAASQAPEQCCSPGLTPSGSQAEAPEFVDLAGPGKKNWIGEVAYFTWEFDQKPKLGPVILKVLLFDKAGQRIQDLEITGRADMPSMAGAHDSGEVAFKLNKKGDYLLPVNIVMPGGWEVRLTFARNGVVIFRGRILFDV